MPTPQPHKTSVTLEADVHLMLQSIIAQRKDLTQADVINLAIRFYYRHADDPTFDAVSSRLATISKQLDDLLARTTVPLDAATLAAELRPLLTPPTPPVTLPPTPILAPTPPRRRWFQKPPPEHW